MKGQTCLLSVFPCPEALVSVLIRFHSGIVFFIPFISFIIYLILLFALSKTISPHIVYVCVCVFFSFLFFFKLATPNLITRFVTVIVVAGINSVYRLFLPQSCAPFDICVSQPLIYVIYQLTSPRPPVKVMCKVRNWGPRVVVCVRKTVRCAL